MNLINTFDYLVLSFMHYLATLNNDFFYAVAKFFSFFGNHGALGLIIICVIMVIPKKTRKLGICGLIAMGIGALMTNLWLKNLVARPRPYNSYVGNYYDWWVYAGATVEKEIFSFPSGHTTATMALMTSLYLNLDHKKAWPLFLIVVMMALSRNYLMVHYPSDVICGMFVGGLAGIVACTFVNDLERWHMRRQKHI